MLVKIGAWLVSHAVSIAEKMADWAVKGVEWIAAIVTAAPGKLWDIITAVGTWVTKSGPSLVYKFGAFAVKGVEWIAAMITSFPGHLANVLTKIGTWVVNNGPALAQKFANFAVRGVEWIGDLVGGLPGDLAGILTSITTWVTNTGPGLATTFGDMGTKIAKGFANAVAGPFIGAINLLIGAIDAIKFDVTLPSFSIPYVGTFGGQKFGWGGVNMGKLGVPTFASGAWNLPKDTLGMLHKGEMIIPERPASTFRSLMGGSGGGGEQTHRINVMLDGRQVAEVVDRHQGTRYSLSGTSKFRPSGG
jgi:hypothetical protein